MRKNHPFWGCYVIKFQLNLEQNIVMSHMSVWRILYAKPKPKKPFKFYEMSKPHAMWHGDIMAIKRLPDGSFAYQLSWEDDYSRAYVASLVETTKSSVIVVKGLIEAILEYKVVPTLVHYDNGSEGKCKIVQVFCEKLGIKLIHSTVEKPNTNGKKERAHRDDKRDLWNNVFSNNLALLKQKNKKYVVWRNTKKGHWALNGQPSSVRLNENKKPSTEFERDYLENLAEVKIDERLVRQGGFILYDNELFYISKNLVGQQVELWETLNGLEIRKGEKIYEIISDYWEKKSEKAVPLLSQF